MNHDNVLTNRDSCSSGSELPDSLKDKIYSSDELEFINEDIDNFLAFEGQPEVNCEEVHLSD